MNTHTTLSRTIPCTDTTHCCKTWTTHARIQGKHPRGVTSLITNLGLYILSSSFFLLLSQDPRGVTSLTDKIPGNDAEFIVDRFETFMSESIQEERPFYAHLTFHAIHEPHPAMPEFYDMYVLY